MYYLLLVVFWVALLISLTLATVQRFGLFTGTRLSKKWGNIGLVSGIIAAIAFVLLYVLGIF